MSAEIRIGFRIAQPNIGDLEIEQPIDPALRRAADAMQEHRLDASLGTVEVIVAVRVPVDRPIGIGNITQPAALIDNFDPNDPIGLGGAVIFNRLKAERRPESSEIAPNCGLVVPSARSGGGVDRHVRASAQGEDGLALGRGGSAQPRNLHPERLGPDRISFQLRVSPGAIGRFVV